MRIYLEVKSPINASNPCGLQTPGEPINLPDPACQAVVHDKRHFLHGPRPRATAVAKHKWAHWGATPPSRDLKGTLSSGLLCMHPHMWLHEGTSMPSTATLKTCVMSAFKKFILSGVLALLWTFLFLYLLVYILLALLPIECTDPGP